MGERKNRDYRRFPTDCFLIRALCIRHPHPLAYFFVLAPVFERLLVRHLDLPASDELKRENRDCSYSFGCSFPMDFSREELYCSPGGAETCEVPIWPTPVEAGV